jgi:hypothetical protein
MWLSLRVAAYGTLMLAGCPACLNNGSEMAGCWESGGDMLAGRIDGPRPGKGPLQKIPWALWTEGSQR